MRKIVAGQSIAEYALAAALVAVVSIGALTFFADDIAAAMPGLMDNIFGGGGGGGALASGAAASGPTTSGPAGGSSGGATGGGSTGGTSTGSGGAAAGSGGSATSYTGPVETACFSSGLCVDVPVVNSSDPASETAGGLGGDLTEQLANVIQQIADQLAEAEPPPDPGLIAMITDLANQGHDIADAEREIPVWFDELDTSGGHCSGLCSNEAIIAHITSLNGNGGMSDQFADQLAVINQFLDDNPGALSGFPEAEAIINFEAQQIIDLAEGITGNASSTVEGEMCAGGATQDSCTFDNYSTTNEADLTDQSADIICASGGDMSSCSTIASDDDGD